MSIFKKSYTEPLPADAIFATIKGVPSARFKRKGRMVTAPLTTAGDRVRLESPSYYGTVDGKPVKLFRDAVASQQRLAELVRKSERKESGLADPFEEHRKRPLNDHLNDYSRFMAAEGNCAEHVAKTTAQIKAIMAGCGFRLINDLASEKVAEFLHGLRRDPPRPVLSVGKVEFTAAELAEALGGNRPVKLARVIAREKLEPATGNGKRRTYPRATVERLQEILCRGVSIATSNGYLTAIKGFSKWLLEKERTDRDRLVSLSRLNANTDKRHERRALDEPELGRLLASAWESAATFEGLAGKDRAMLYMLAMTTGLRASELSSVTPSAFTLATDRPTVTVRAAYTKNRQEAEQPLPADVAEAFRDYLRGRPPMAALWPGKWNDRAAEMLRVDLAGAGIDYRDAEGGVADFHALRHSYISLLGRAGVSPKVTQTLARHSDIRLTMNVYSHAQIHDLSAAVDGLTIKMPGGNRSEPNELAATGTDGKPAGNSLPFPCRTNEARGGNLMLHDNAGNNTDERAGETQAVEMMTLADGNGRMIRPGSKTTIFG
jgi:integrase